MPSCKLEKNYYKSIVRGSVYKTPRSVESQLKAIQVCAYVPLIVLPTVFSMTCYKIVMQHFPMVYHGISHLSLVFSTL